MVPWFQMLLPSLMREMQELVQARMMLQLSQTVMLFMIQEMQAGVKQKDVAAVTGSDVVGDRRDASWCKPE